MWLLRTSLLQRCKGNCGSGNKPEKHAGPWEIATGLFSKTGPRLTSSVNITFIIKNIGNYLEDFETFVFLYPGLDSIVSNTLSLCLEEHLGMHGHWAIQYCASRLRQWKWKTESVKWKHVAYFHEINNESGFKWKTLLDLVTMEKIRLHWWNLV